MPDIDELKPDIAEKIGAKKWTDVRKLVTGIPAPDIADLLLTLEKRDRVILFRLLPRQLAADVFSYLAPPEKDKLLTELTDSETRRILADLSADDRTELFGELPGEAVQKMLNLLGPEDLKEARQLLGYPEESVGRLMTPDYVAVHEGWTTGQALEHIRTKGREVETINTIYVVDSSWKLLDSLGLDRFVLADPNDPVRNIMDYTYTSISAYEDRERAVHLTRHYDLNALPVVDSAGTLLGIVTVDDIMDVAEKEATEDFHKVGAVTPLRTSYHHSSVWSLYRKRIGWLTTLLAVNLVSSGVVAAYEETLASALALAFFIPLLIDSGGNTGAQSSTLMVRAISTGDLRLGQWLWAAGREAGIGLLLGVTMALAAWFVGFLRGGMEIAMIVSFSMAIIVLIANLLGVLLPFLLTRAGLDPAMASSPLITSLVDVLGLLVYFSIAASVLGAG